jgi:very-short-patch-repair endonuclease
MVTTGNLEGYSWEERINIRKIYEELDESDIGRNDPYMIDLKFSPIEYQMWYSIRIRNKTRYFRPEYPIGKYFADFADPIHKIVIECDGKEFHTDIEKDRIRQNEIEEMGWIVLRFNAKQILSNIHDGQLLNLFESGKIDEDEFNHRIFLNKNNCVDCYLESEDFKQLLKSRNGKV